MRRRLSLAAAAALLSQAAAGVSLDPGGLGQALVYPYFTVRSVGGDPFNTYLSIVNTTGTAKVLRVRLREGAEGAEALGFNLYLAPGDAWTAAVVPDGAGARVVSRDTSCIDPPSAGSSTLSAGTTEGYVEVLEMATLSGTAAGHVRSRNCAALPGSVGVAGALQAPTGGLMGTLTLINVQSGRDYTVNADALADLATAAYYRPPSDPYPDYNAAEVARVSHMTVDGATYRLLWLGGLQAVSSVFMQQRVENELVFDPGTASSTEWILTMPTRRLHAVAGTYTAPFTGACQEIGFNHFDREVLTNIPVGSDYGYPIPGPCVRFAATVATFKRSGYAVQPELGSSNLRELGLSGNYTNGRGWITMVRDPSMTSLPGSMRRDAAGSEVRGAFTLRGLPVTGFMVRSFSNGVFSCGGSKCSSTFGGAFPHVPQRVIIGP
jgi:hypothetical protein